MYRTINYSLCWEDQDILKNARNEARLLLLDDPDLSYYGNQKILGRAIAEALNKEVLSLANAGCKHIQIDEPLFARYPEKATEFGIDNLERSFHNCPDTVSKTTHICCGSIDFCWIFS